MFPQNETKFDNLKYFYILFSLILIFMGCFATYSLISKDRVSETEIKFKIREYVGSMSRAEALSFVRKYYDSKSGEKDITNDRFFYLKYVNSSNSYGHSRVKFVWKTVTDIEPRLYKWSDGDAEFRITIHFPVLDDNKKIKDETYNIASFKSYEEKKFYEMLAALYVLSDRKSSPNTGYQTLSRESSEKRLPGPYSADHAVVFGKVTIESPVKLSAKVTIVETENRNDIRQHEVRAEDTGIFYIVNVNANHGYRFDEIELYQNNASVGSLNVGMVTINSGDKKSQILNLGEIKITIKDDGSTSYSLNIPTDLLKDKLSQTIFSQPRFSNWYGTYKNKIDTATKGQN